MKIAVVNNCVPFISGGAEYLADALVKQLRERGHETMLTRIPFRWNPPACIVDSMLACRLMRLIHADRVIALKFPAYYLPHDNKVLWLLHQFRQAYDLWGTPWQDIPDTDEGRRIRESVIHADNLYLREAKAIYTNSHVTGERLKTFNGIDSTVLYPPLLDPARFRCEGYGDYIFYPSRITRGKRQYLVVEAMKHTRTAVKLVIAGGAETESDLRLLEETVERNGLQDRVTVIARFISEEEKVRWFANALACAYTPVDEDSYGYVTLEAFEARKPVISCTDSGGVSILVKDGETGCLVPAEAPAIARAMDSLFLDRRRARDLGEAGLRRVESLRITWDHVVERLTS
jgi:glycosyltransferase involved in cell wall biosynthesis